ncbi:LPS export ABC transporter permease LptF [Acuticoccus mangrovi]|uniref:LPS export ABC transporter permease LptF n=1 Tax=Acuticoccus mangrovi TaxID=2796142 RepID=A0A934IHQ4_9HYPH|nr:LPS export ABC transporter permease LptF [Acuticoccus mangrovi]MBJ3776673.1 LPS export ABC transporter permease LptF [Acuticoccus mangrovi]
MPLINWYMCRRILTLFPAGLFILTAIIWSTQALQRLDLVTAKGQTFAVFFELTLLAVPFLATLLAPIAFVIAMVAVYDSLNRDSELVVIGAAGAGRLRLLAPALYAAAVCAALVAVGVVYLAPVGLAKARVMLTEVRADVVTSIVQPGRFIEIEDGLTVHIRDRLADGTLEGLLLDDRRREDLHMTYLAETGRVVEAEDNTLLVMTNGSVQRMERPSGELSVVAFDAYAFDLTDLTSGPTTTTFRPSERTLLELLTPDPDDTYRAEREARFEIELHDRLSQPLAPFVYALVVFLFVGDPRMHRQSRLAGIFAAGLAVAAVRGATYGTLLAAESSPGLAPLVYVFLLAVGGGALYLIVTDRTITLHERAAAHLVKLAARLVAHPGKAAA